MTLIDRYLHAVRGFLPASRQDDIIRELSDDIHSQVADREEELARPLTEAEIGTVLTRFGHPMLLAARYRRRQHLIGPAVFPFYWMVLKWAVGIAFIVHAAIAVALVVSGAPAERILDPIMRFPFGPAVTVFGWVTLVFAVADMNVIHATGLGSWSPRDLPTPQRPARSPLPIIGQVIGTAVGFGWWLALPHLPVVVFGPAASFLAFSAAFHSVYMPVSVLWGANLVFLCLIVLRRDWSSVRMTGQVVSSAAALVGACILLRAGDLVTLSAADPSFERAIEAVRLINAGVRIGLLAFAGLSVWEIVRAVVKARRMPAL